ncbi:MAG: S-layer protein [Candidatus Aenigmatarchaeota archaeon]
MYKKFVASFMTALMAAMTLVSPALGATALNTYPTFLGKVGDFYVVVGEEAAASDIAGAIDIAANLAQLSYKETTVTGATVTGLTGIERKIAIPTSNTGSKIVGQDSNQLPTPLRNFHFSGLKEGQFEYKGTNYNYHEEVRSPQTSALTLTHSLSDPINGTLKMKVESNGIEYRYVFDSAIPAGSLPSSPNSSSYSDPLVVNVLGREFKIVSISGTSFKALTGSVDWVEQGSTTGLTVGELTALVTTVYSGPTPQAAIKIVDSSGNTVTDLLVTTTGKSFTYKGETYNVKVLQTATVAAAGLGTNRAQLLFGKGDVEKNFDGTTTSTVSEWGSQWKIGTSSNFETNGGIPAGAYIRVTYEPDSLTNAERYFSAGSVFQGPAGYFELKFAGYSPDKFAKVTIEDSGSQTLYNSTATTGYGSKSNLRGLKISTTTPGTIVNGSNNYDEVYLLFSNATQATSNQWSGTYYHLGYKDKTTGRIVALSSTYYNGVNITNADSGTTDPAGLGIWNFTLSYGGSGSTQFVVRGNFNNQTLLNGVEVYNLTSGGSLSVLQVRANFMNRTTASSSLPPELILGTGASTADTDDVKALIESNTVTDVSTQVGDLITDGGIQLYSVKSNAEANKVVLGVPPETVYGLVQFGKIGETTTTAGGTVKEVIPVTAAVAKLDTEIGTPEKAKNLVSVGGPCVNKVSADAMGKKFPACGADSGIQQNTGLIQVFDGTYTSGKVVVVVAGWEAKDTRLASSVLQNYADKLKDVTASKVTITGTALATATITPG